MSRLIHKLVQLSLLLILMLPVFALVSPAEPVSAQVPCALNAIRTENGCIRQDAPNCFNHSGSTGRACQNAAAYGLQPGRCYTETRTGPNGTLSGYQETSCGDPTDRDQDGVPGGDGSAAEDVNFETDCNEVSLNKENCGIVAYLVVIIRVLSAVVGVVVMIMIAWGGIQYSSARDNPQQAASAKDHIRNAVFALIFYIFSIALLNYLIPGGVF